MVLLARLKAPRQVREALIGLAQRTAVRCRTA